MTKENINRNFTSGQHVCPHGHPAKADMTPKKKGSTLVNLSSSMHKLSNTNEHQQRSQCFPTRPYKKIDRQYVTLPISSLEGRDTQSPHCWKKEPRVFRIFSWTFKIKFIISFLQPLVNHGFNDSNPAGFIQSIRLDRQMRVFSLPGLISVLTLANAVWFLDASLILYFLALICDEKQGGPYSHRNIQTCPFTKHFLVAAGCAHRVSSL